MRKPEVEKSSKNKISLIITAQYLCLIAYELNHKHDESGVAPAFIQTSPSPLTVSRRTPAQLNKILNEKVFN